MKTYAACDDGVAITPANYYYSISHNIYQGPIDSYVFKLDRMQALQALVHRRPRFNPAFRLPVLNLNVTKFNYPEKATNCR